MTTSYHLQLCTIFLCVRVCMYVCVCSMHVFMYVCMYVGIHVPLFQFHVSFPTLQSPISPFLLFSHFLVLFLYDVRVYVLTGGQHDQLYGQSSRQLYTATRTQYLLTCLFAVLHIHRS
jgi:hypothetical protein